MLVLRVASYMIKYFLLPHILDGGAHQYFIEIAF